MFAIRPASIDKHFKKFAITFFIIGFVYKFFAESADIFLNTFLGFIALLGIMFVMRRIIFHKTLRIFLPNLGFIIALIGLYSSFPIAFTTLWLGLCFIFLYEIISRFLSIRRLSEWGTILLISYIVIKLLPILTTNVGIVCVAAISLILFLLVRKLNKDIENTQIYIKYGRYKDTLIYIDKLLKYQPMVSFLYAQKGFCLIKLGNSEEALEVLYKGLRINPSNDSIINNISWANNLLGKFPEALDYATKGLKIDPHDVMLLINRGVALKGLKRYKEAMEALNESLSIKETPEALFSKAKLLLEIEQYEEAVKNFKEYLSYLNEDVEALFYTAICFHELGNYDEALRYFDKAIELNSTEYHLYMWKARILYLLKMYEDSIRTYRTVLKLDADNAEAYFGLAKLYATTGNIENARYLLSLAIQLDETYIEIASKDLVLSDYVPENIHENYQTTPNILH